MWVLFKNAHMGKNITEVPGLLDCWQGWTSLGVLKHSWGEGKNAESHTVFTPNKGNSHWRYRATIEEKYMGVLTDGKDMAYQN